MGLIKKVTQLNLATFASLSSNLTDVIENPTDQPEEFQLFQNYPNPFNPATTIRFNISKQEFVKLIIHDIIGNEIVVLINEKKLPGEYKIEFVASKFSSGIYFYSLVTTQKIITRKMILLK